MGFQDKYLLSKKFNKLFSKSGIKELDNSTGLTIQFSAYSLEVENAEIFFKSLIILTENEENILIIISISKLIKRLEKLEYSSSIKLLNILCKSSISVCKVINVFKMINKIFERDFKSLKIIKTIIKKYPEHLDFKKHLNKIHKLPIESLSITFLLAEKGYNIPDKIINKILKNPIELIPLATRVNSIISRVIPKLNFKYYSLTIESLLKSFSTITRGIINYFLIKYPELSINDRENVLKLLLIILRNNGWDGEGRILSEFILNNETNDINWLKLFNSLSLILKEGVCPTQPTLYYSLLEKLNKPLPGMFKILIYMPNPSGESNLIINYLRNLKEEEEEDKEEAILFLQKITSSIQDLIPNSEDSPKFIDILLESALEISKETSENMIDYISSLPNSVKSESIIKTLIKLLPLKRNEVLKFFLTWSKKLKSNLKSVRLCLDFSVEDYNLPFTNFHSLNNLLLGNSEGLTSALIKLNSNSDEEILTHIYTLVGSQSSRPDLIAKIGAPKILLKNFLISNKVEEEVQKRGGDSKSRRKFKEEEEEVQGRGSEISELSLQLIMKIISTTARIKCTPIEFSQLLSLGNKVLSIISSVVESTPGFSSFISLNPGKLLISGIPLSNSYSISFWMWLPVEPERIQIISFIQQSQIQIISLYIINSQIFIEEKSKGISGGACFENVFISRCRPYHVGLIHQPKNRKNSSKIFLFIDGVLVSSVNLITNPGIKDISIGESYMRIGQLCIFKGNIGEKAIRTLYYLREYSGGFQDLLTLKNQILIEGSFEDIPFSKIEAVYSKKSRINNYFPNLSSIDGEPIAEIVNGTVEMVDLAQNSHFVTCGIGNLFVLIEQTKTSLELQKSLEIFRKTYTSNWINKNEIDSNRGHHLLSLVLSKTKSKIINSNCISEIILLMIYPTTRDDPKVQYPNYSMFESSLWSKIDKELFIEFLLSIQGIIESENSEYNLTQLRPKLFKFLLNEIIEINIQIRILRILFNYGASIKELTLFSNKIRSFKTNRKPFFLIIKEISSFIENFSLIFNPFWFLSALYERNDDIEDFLLIFPFNLFKKRDISHLALILHEIKPKKVEPLIKIFLKLKRIETVECLFVLGQEINLNDSEIIKYISKTRFIHTMISWIKEENDNLFECLKNILLKLPSRSILPCFKIIQNKSNLNLRLKYETIILSTLNEAKTLNNVPHIQLGKAVLELLSNGWFEYAILNIFLYFKAIFNLIEKKKKKKKVLNSICFLLLKALENGDKNGIVLLIENQSMIFNSKQQVNKSILRKFIPFLSNYPEILLQIPKETYLKRRIGSGTPQVKRPKLNPFHLSASSYKPPKIEPLITFNKKLKKELIENNLFLNLLKKFDEVYTEKRWKKLRDSISQKSLNIQSTNRWCLNPSEGPMRIRKRLIRNKNPPTIENPIKVEEEPEEEEIIFNPLHIPKIIENSGKLLTSKIQSIRVHGFEQIPGYSIITENRFFFIPFSLLTNKPKIKYFIKIKKLKIKRILNRRFLLKDTAIEIFLNDGRTFFISFADSYRNKFNKLLSPKPSFGLSLKKINKKWLKGKISNFEYLMELNTISGRSFVDYCQYPIFPWILKNYQDDLNIEDFKFYRDLSLNMGSLNLERKKMFIERYYQFDDPEIPPFHFGSHYSNPGTTLFYLMRLEPYTNHYVNFHGGKYDVSQRMFFSIENSFNTSSGFKGQNLADVKELIPEFFFLSEFLLNLNGYDFGIRENDGGIVGSVDLPKWATSPEHFIVMHRRALESSFVSENLNYWIDLIFGYKQRGEEAINNTNVFYHLTYENPGENSTDATLSQIINFGQTPKQLFKKPHPLKIKEESFNDYSFSFVELVKHTNSIKVNEILIIENKIFFSGPNEKLFLKNKKNSKLVFNFPDDSLRIISEGFPIVIRECMHFGSITDVAVSRNSIFTSGTDNLINCWKFKKNQFILRRRLIGHSSSIEKIIISEPWNIIVSIASNVIIWDLNSLAYIRTIPQKFKFININEISGEICLANYNNISLYSINGTLLFNKEIDIQLSAICMLLIDVYRQDFRIISGHYDGFLRFWKLNWKLKILEKDYSVEICDNIITEIKPCISGDIYVGDKESIYRVKMN